MPANLNPSNRPVRIRMPGGVAEVAENQPPRPYADLMAMHLIGANTTYRRITPKVGRNEP